MKVSLCIQPALKNRSGVGWYTQRLTEHLLLWKQEHSNALQVSDKHREMDLEALAFNFLHRTPVSADILELGIPLTLSPLMHYGLYRRIWHFLPVSYNRIFHSHADIYHFFDYLIPPRITGKTVVNIYDMVYKRYPETMKSSNRRRLENGLRDTVRRAHRIVTISRSAQNEIVEYLQVDPAVIHIIPPGVDLQTYAAPVTENQRRHIRAQYRLPEEYLLYLGTLEPRKNIEGIVTAYQHLLKTDRHLPGLVIAGAKGWKFDTLFDLINKLKLTDKVHFTGYVAESDKPAIYQMAEIFLFPSHYEGFGMPVLEAMAAGVPVITANSSALPEVAGDGALLVDPDNHEMIAQAMERLLADTALRGELISRGYRRASAFTWTASAQKLIDLYQNLYYD